MSILKDKCEEWDFTNPPLKLPSKVFSYMEFLEQQEEKELKKYLNSSNKNSFWYLASPYSKYENLEIAYENTAKMLAFLTDNGIFTFSPITHYHTCAKNTKEQPRSEEWNKICCQFLIISRGMIVCMMHGWEESKGIAKEIKLATELHLPIIYTNFMELPKFE